MAGGKTLMAHQSENLGTTVETHDRGKESSAGMKTQQELLAARQAANEPTPIETIEHCLEVIWEVAGRNSNADDRQLLQGAVIGAHAALVELHAQAIPRPRLKRPVASAGTNMPQTAVWTRGPGGSNGNNDG